MTVLRRIGLLFLALLFASQAAALEEARELQFRVLMNGKEIGYHHYRIRDLTDGFEVRSDARFDVRFLFITAYRYRHSTVERWQGDCLREIESNTDANGKKETVAGVREADGFVVNATAGVNSLPGCISTFAYWDPSFLRRAQLLNPQTGDYVDVEVVELGQSEITVRGSKVVAHQFQLTAESMQLDLWYSKSNEWLALESAAKGGRTIRYELI